MSSSSAAYVYAPTDIDGIREAIQAAQECGLLVALKGGGNSYGDSFQSAEGVVIDLSRMNRVLSWDASTGIVVCEPGVTISDLWRFILPDGWWPPVVSGTSRTTIGGALAANIHGKNSFSQGPFGDHVLQFELLMANGEIAVCSRVQHSDLFYAVIGGFGLFGAVISITLQTHKIHSGLVEVEAYRTRNWAQTFQAFESLQPLSDYLVGWIDCFAGGRASGRGLIHAARYLTAEQDPHPEETLRISAQELPDSVFGWISRSRLHRIMRPFVRPLGVRFVNCMKYCRARAEHGTRTRAAIVPFNFLLDSAPNWKLSYKPGWLIQYQCFIPLGRAEATFEKIVSLSQGRGLAPFLGVMKKHRADAFLLSHGVEGFSLALDYRVTQKNQEAVMALFRVLDDTVFEAEGRFYLAKDAVLTPSSIRRIWGEDVIAKFLDLKRQVDPTCIFQSEQSKRIFGVLEPLEPKFPPAEWGERPVVESTQPRIVVEEE